MNRRTLLTGLLSVAPVSFVSTAFAQFAAPNSNTPPPQTNKTEDSSKTGLLTALVTAAVTILGVTLKDFIFKVLAEHRAERRAKLAVYERYSQPLAASAISLLNRLHEILLQDYRPVFLKGVGIPLGVGPGPEFRAYKKLSTLYRLASLLGWIRACRREFSYLRVAERKENEPIDSAISAFESALADGSWVERERVRRLCGIWDLCGPEHLENARQILEAIGVKVDNAIYDRLEQARVQDLNALSEGDRKALCAAIADLLADSLRMDRVTAQAVDRTWAEAFSAIAMHEAWVYRDWQSAIGDMMLRPEEGEARKFEVLGYGEFEQMYLSGDHMQKEWIRRLSEVFDGVNLSIEDRFDARPRQLRTLARANAQLVVALRHAQGSRTIVADSTLDIARTILAKVVVAPK